MNSRKVLRLTVSYAELMSRCPPEQLSNAKLLKEKHKHYRERLYEIPEEPPKIDWEYYKCNVRPEYMSMVEEFEKKYNEFKVPYPEDPYTPQLEEMKKTVEKEICAYKEESNKRIEALEDEIVIKCCQTPIEEITWEEYCELYPDTAPDFINRPTFWPHTPEEQIPGPSNPKLVAQMHKEMHELEENFGRAYFVEDKKDEKRVELKDTKGKELKMAKGIEIKSEKTGKKDDKNVIESEKMTKAKLETKDKLETTKSKEEIDKTSKISDDKQKTK